jgi:murein DD-endopeptidase / murein LD-carboxypeptidase
MSCAIADYLFDFQAIKGPVVTGGPREPFAKKYCHWRTLSAYRKPTAIKKRKLILYVFCLFIFVQVVAANIGHDPHVGDPQLHEKILAFRRSGIEKKINTDNYNIEGIIAYAESLLGTPHTMGGYSPSGLDCSGLVKLAHAQFDVELPHSSHEQARYGTIISPGEELKRGDLVFFHSTYATPKLVTHSGIYLGENKFIHTSSSRGVSISAVLDSAYWQDHYLFATRLGD